MSMKTELRKRVRRGVIWLDENQPGWEQQIDLEQLNMADGGYCIIGQTATMTGWASKLAELGLRDSSHSWMIEQDEALPDAVNLGFQKTSSEPSVVYEILQQLWEAEVNSRRPLGKLEAIELIASLPKGVHVQVKVVTS